MKKIIVILFISANALTAATIDERVENILSQMTLEEKINYIGGTNNFSTHPIPRLGVPEITMADGPLGVRKFAPSIAYPATITLASAWDQSLAAAFGSCMGKDARARGVHILLAPGMNLYRAPQCGRNFEYFGEDPYLAARMAVNVIKGIQSQEVIATAKHFVANNQEWDRHHVSSDIDERTLRELYLPAFEACIKEANVGALMDGYNLVNGQHMSENRYFNVDIAKKEWGFSGILISDWTSTYDGIKAANGGLDLEMPYALHMTKETLIPAIERGEVTVDTIDDKVRRILRTAIAFHFFDRPQRDPQISLCSKESRQVAEEIALAGSVLLKNEGILPLDKTKCKKVAVIGPRAQQNIPVAGGSSKLTPIISTSFLAGISDALDPTCQLYYSRGIPNFFKKGRGLFSPILGSKEKGLLGEYFDNIELAGAPILTRVDHDIGFQWKEKSFVQGGPVNDYSVRWTGYFTPPTTTDFTAFASGNDGYRLFFDEKLILDHWDGAGVSFQHTSLHLEAGKSYRVQLEYYVKKGSQAIDFGIVYGVSEELEHAKEIAAFADTVILCVGFDEEHEGEDWDRSFSLPLAQDLLISAILQTNKNCVIVMTAGGAVDMASWIDNAPALLYAWYPGQEGAKAISKILFGEVSPSGKLPCSFERRLEDNACFSSYYDSKKSKRVAYTEGLLLGYRHFDKTGIKPLFPFGYGLSYTTFSYSNLQFGENNSLSFDITNVGQRAGAEVAQVYVRDTHSKVVRPEKELKGFSKVFLEPGETKSVTLSLDARAFSYYDVEKKEWTLEPGTFEILVGSSSVKIELTGNMLVTP